MSSSQRMILIPRLQENPQETLSAALQFSRGVMPDVGDKFYEVRHKFKAEKETSSGRRISVQEVS